MVGARIRSTLIALVGVVLGYLAWLAVVCAALAFTPVHRWAIAVAIGTATLIAGSPFTAYRHRSQPWALGFRLAPVLPVAVSLYTVFILGT